MFEEEFVTQEEFNESILKLDQFIENKENIVDKELNSEWWKEEE